MASKRKVKKKAKKRTAKKRTAKRRTAKRRTKKKKTTKRRAKKRKTAKRKATKKKAKRKKTKRKPNPAFMKPVTPDTHLAAVVGAKPMPRTELTKKLWAYIRRNGLQDKRNRRMINADASLRRVFNGRSQVSMFEMTKLVNRHVK